MINGGSMSTDEGRIAVITIVSRFFELNPGSHLDVSYTHMSVGLSEEAVEPALAYLQEIKFLQPIQTGVFAINKSFWK
jgi:hypothetical protein